ncbi:YbaB/EbfC family nucleoid-associated protein [Natronospora cellulosivora (SeqCode)]
MDMNNMNILEKIETIKKRLAELKEELAEIKVEGQDENKTITAVVSGKGQILDYNLNLGQIGALNKETLIKAVVDASNNGLKAAKEIEANKRKEIIGELNLPDMPGLF